MPTLRRTLGLFELTIYGVGIILGAGIYAIIGEGAGAAGNAIWLSFVIAAIVAALSGLSYAELAGRFPKAAAEYQYARHAFGRERLAFLIGWIMLVAGVVSASTVALGFAGYLSALAGTPIVAGAVGLIAVLSLINFIGIRESSAFNIVSTLIEFSGLVIVIALGLPAVGAAAVDFSLSPNGMAGILGATAIIFFAYIGFENLANMGEEAARPRTDLPRALLLAVAISTILYILTALAAVAAVGWERLASSPAPLTEVVAASGVPWLAPAFSVIALFATGNTILIMLIVVSRMLYRLAYERRLPAFLARVHRSRRTPHYAVAATGIAAAALVLPGNLGAAAALTNASIFLGYLAVNASLIAIRARERSPPRGFRVPGAIGKVPVVPVLGALASAGMLLLFDPLIWLSEAALLGIGFAVGAAVARRRRAYRTCAAPACRRKHPLTAPRGLRQSSAPRRPAHPRSAPPRRPP